MMLSYTPDGACAIGRAAALGSGIDVGNPVEPAPPAGADSPLARLEHRSHDGGGVHGDQQPVRRQRLHADHDSGRRIPGRQEFRSRCADALEVPRRIVHHVDREPRDIGGRRARDLQDDSRSLRSVRNANVQFETQTNRRTLPRRYGDGVRLVECRAFDRARCGRLQRRRTAPRIPQHERAARPGPIRPGKGG